MRNLLPGIANGVWRVDGEPLVIYSMDDVTVSANGLEPSSKRILLCSERLAEELERDGVLTFSKQDGEEEVRTS